jgi:tetratricopeptide (TPR) repeat protein
MTTARRSAALALISMCLCSTSAFAQSPSPAEEAIAAATRVVAARPGEVDGHNQLALAFARRARESADVTFYEKANEAIDRALRLDPGNFEAQKLRAWVLLGQHEFQRALDLARTLNAKAPDDLLVYGFLTDAHVELGNYAEAETACQWMLDLRPGNVPAFTRAAYLRELFGDIEGAIELMTQAHERTSPLEVEERAWILTQLGHLELIARRGDNAERVLRRALELFPDYHYALAALAKVRTAQNRHAAAVDLLQRRYDLAPHPENLFALGEALVRAGRHDDAHAAFTEFEGLARREASTWDNANRELIFYYTNHAGRPAAALEVARMEMSRRQDVYTLDAYAWALHANGRHEEARAAIERALAVGLKDPEVLARADVIAKAATRAASAP